MNSAPINVFVSGLPKSYDEAALKRLCEPCGRLSSVKLMLDAKTGGSRCFGFALYVDPECAHKAVRMLNGFELPCGHRIHAELSKHHAQQILHRSNQALIRNIPSSTPEALVREYFAQYGTVLDLVTRRDIEERLMLNVTYATEDEANAAVLGTHGKKPFVECEAPLLAKLFETSSSRKARIGSGSSVGETSKDALQQPPLTSPSYRSWQRVLTPAAMPQAKDVNAHNGIYVPQCGTYCYDPYSMTCPKRFLYN